MRWNSLSGQKKLMTCTENSIVLRMPSFYAISWFQAPAFNVPRLPCASTCDGVFGCHWAVLP